MSFGFRQIWRTPGKIQTWLTTTALSCILWEQDRKKERNWDQIGTDASWETAVFCWTLMFRYVPLGCPRASLGLWPRVLLECWGPDLDVCLSVGHILDRPWVWQHHNKGQMLPFSDCVTTKSSQPCEKGSGSKDTWDMKCSHCLTGCDPSHTYASLISYVHFVCNSVQILSDYSKHCVWVSVAGTKCLSTSDGFCLWFFLMCLVCQL